MEKLLTNPEEIWYTDERSFVLDGKKRERYTVRCNHETIEAKPLPPGASAQLPELVTLIWALKLGNWNKVAAADSKYDLEFILHWVLQEQCKWYSIPWAFDTTWVTAALKVEPLSLWSLEFKILSTSWEISTVRFCPIVDLRASSISKAITVITLKQCGLLRATISFST